LLSAAYKLQEALTLVGGYGANDLASDQSMTNVGLKLDLSKRTYTYISYVRATGGAQSSLAQRGNYALSGTSNATTVIGVAHSF
jgi:predicted porin